MRMNAKSFRHRHRFLKIGCMTLRYLPILLLFGMVNAQVILYDTRTNSGDATIQQAQETDSANWHDWTSRIPDVLTQLPGSFTHVGGQQSIALVRRNDAEGDSRTYWGTYELQLIENNSIALILPYDGFDLVGTTDLNGDGIHEILMSGSGFGQGVEVQQLKLMVVIEGKLQEFRDFGFVYEDNCSTGSENRKITNTLITTRVSDDKSQVLYNIQTIEQACQ
jgi:hypothetical protein